MTPRLPVNHRAHRAMVKLVTMESRMTEEEAGGAALILMAYQLALQQLKVPQKKQVSTLLALIHAAQDFCSEPDQLLHDHPALLTDEEGNPVKGSDA